MGTYDYYASGVGKGAIAYLGNAAQSMPNSSRSRSPPGHSGQFGVPAVRLARPAATTQQYVSPLAQLAPTQYEYIEGEIQKAYHCRRYDNEAEAKEACDAASICLGYYHHDGKSGSFWGTLKPGLQAWSRGIPDANIVSVKVKHASVITFGGSNRPGLSSRAASAPRI